MRLIYIGHHGKLKLMKDVATPPVPYAILSHTWGDDDDEFTFDDLKRGRGTSKPGYAKLQFCANQAKKDGFRYFWVDTCCINRASLSELDEAIRSMFRWYQDAAICYVYLTDVRLRDKNSKKSREWKSAFYKSRWFTRGWTLQELLAPKSVEFFSQEEESLGTKTSLEKQIHEITRIPVEALRGASLSQFQADERLRWAEHRETKKTEDKAYCLIGIFQVSMSLRYGEGPDAVKRLKEKISKKHGSGPSTLHTHWTVARRPNPLFTGREDVLHELGTVIDRALAAMPHHEQSQIVVSGMGGQGKSELCLQLAHRFRQKFWGVFWVDVSTIATAQASFLELARKLGLPAHSWEEACLGIANLQQPWLLVLDNADDPDTDYLPYFPDSYWGVVMVTSRNEECQQYATAKATALEGLTADAAQQLLMKSARVPADQYDALQEDTARVATLLQSHPLALIQAGAFVARGHCQLSQYPEVYKKQRRQLLEFRPTQAQSRYSDVYATFEASADALKQSTAATAGDALDLLSLLAVGGPSQLPLIIFEGGWDGARKVRRDMDEHAEDSEVRRLTPWHVARLPSFLDVSKSTWDSFRLMEAVQLLKAFALVTSDMAGDLVSVSMHPLVHAWARDRQSPDEQHKHWASMACILAFARNSSTIKRTHDRPLQAHIESAVSWDVDTMFADAPPMLVARVLVGCGWLLNQMRSDLKVFMLTQMLITKFGLDESTVDRSWVGLYNLLCRNLVHRALPREAIHLLEQVAEIQKESLGADRPSQSSRKNDLATVQHELARAYLVEGRIKESVQLLEEVVKMGARSMTANHPAQLASRHELARAYYEDGRVKDAVELLEELVRVDPATLVRDHPTRLAHQHLLARAYLADGQVKKSVEMLEEVVSIELQSLATDNPARLESLHELARAYSANGQVEEAIALLEEVVAIEAHVLAADHPDRLLSQYNLAIYFSRVDEYERACDLMRQVVEIRREKLDENHPDTVEAEDWLYDFEKELARLDDGHSTTTTTTSMPLRPKRMSRLKFWKEKV